MERGRHAILDNHRNWKAGVSIHADQFKSAVRSLHAHSCVFLSIELLRSLKGSEHAKAATLVGSQVPWLASR